MSKKGSGADLLQVIGALTIIVGIPVLAVVGLRKLAESKNRFSKKITPHDPFVRNTAVKIARNHPGSYNVTQALAIFNWVKNNIRYVSDPLDREYIATPIETLETQAGDCDDMAVLTASMIKSIGGSARVGAVYSKNTGHAFCELYLGSSGTAQSILLDVHNYYSLSKMNPIHFELDELGQEWLIFDTQLMYPGAFPMMAEKKVEGWDWSPGNKIKYHY